MLTVAISKRNKLQNIIVLTPKDGWKGIQVLSHIYFAVDRVVYLRAGIYYDD